MEILVMLGVLMYLVTSSDRTKKNEEIRTIFREELKSYHEQKKSD